MPARIFVQDGKMRQEFNDERGQTVTILRPDLRVYWIIMPREQAYAELPLRGKLPGQFIQMPPTPEQAPAGQGDGRRLRGPKISSHGARTPGAGNSDVWVATKLGTPVKMISKEGNLSIEYKDIKEGAQAERLFSLPPGYQSWAPAGFGDRVR